ncbi:hypothetical protein D3C72_1384940 [compost metagenome]
MYAKAEEAQCGGIENRRGEAQGGLDDQRRHAVGQHGDEHQARQAGTGQACGGHVVAVQLAHHRGAGQTNVGRQGHHGDGDHGVDQARAEDGDDRHGQQQGRQGQHDVHQTHDARAKYAREEPGEQTQQDPRDQRHHHRRQTDQQRQARALDQARQQVATQFIGAEQELHLSTFQPGRRGQQEITVLLARVVRGNPRGEDGAENHQQHEHQAGDGTFVLGKRLPEFFVRRRVQQALIDCYRWNWSGHGHDLSADDGCVGWQSRRGCPLRS